ncbi:MAG: phosphocholine cytidylyltransferase family protein [Deltaproteobacteria bacterium]|nr:phosphocholine cytidylyltransferase family protein [Deltaproteobacteria bacterium]
MLSAGQGKRLLPKTSDKPKCLLPLDGRSVLSWQLEVLAANGVDRVTVVTGYGADLVDEELAGYRREHPGQQVETLYNCDYATSDNLVSCWQARAEMVGDFLLINGDTIFEKNALKRLLAGNGRPVTVTISRKDEYDADDMKVCLEGERLVRIGKDLDLQKVDGESIGMILFRDRGGAWFRDSMERALATEAARRRWYLSVIDTMASAGEVWTCSIAGMAWQEIDYPADLEEADRLVKDCRLGLSL